ncbi:MAG: group III truncated hemoglobin [Bacteroidota bacterium]|nr:group III truncated hemoglobin [Bacteroidota bacterium]
MHTKKDIATLQDIQVLVNSFYDKVQKNELLAPIFNNVIQNHWPEHLEKMYCFWETILLDANTYSGVPFLPHANLPVQHEHFEYWIAIFIETIDTHFEGIKADEAKWRAGKMAVMFESKINYLSKNTLKPLR